MDNHTPEPPVKKCTKCGEEKPCTAEHFVTAKGEPRQPCRECDRRIKKEKRIADPEHRRRRGRAYYQRYAESIKAAMRQSRADNPEHHRALARRSREKHIEKRRAQVRVWQATHRDEQNEKRRAQYAANPEFFRAQLRESYQRNKGKRQEYDRTRRDPEKRKLLDKQKRLNKPAHYRALRRAWAKRHPEHALHQQHIRRARAAGLPRDFTNQQWRDCLAYWNSCCCACGKHISVAPLDRDHWQALSKGGGYTLLNIVPLCGGVDGCNQKKFNSEARTWLVSEFGELQGNAIYARVIAYFNHMK